MSSDSKRLTVLQGKFAAYLSWSQPFLYALLRGLEPHCRNVIICNRTENLERFPIDNIVRLKTRSLVRPSGALLAAMHLSREWQPDILHAHFGWSGIRMLLLKQFLRIPMVTTFGGKDAGTQMHMPHYDRLYEILLKASDQLVCVSDDLKRQLVEHGVDADRIEVIRRGTNLEQFRFVDRSERPADRPVKLLMVGRLVEKKGHRYAFEALSRLVQRGRNATLTIVGEGDDYATIRRLRNELRLQGYVTFAGSTNHEGVRQLMDDADVFLHCSVTGSDGDCEGIPNVIVEAAATGLPVVGTRHGGIVETIRHGETGYLVDEADADALADSIEQLVQRRETRIAFGRAGSQFMHREFNLQTQIERYVAMYERLVGLYQVGRPPTPQHFIPDDFAQIITNTLQPTMGVKDFSLAELGEWIFGPGRLTGESTSPRERLFERCYNLKQYVPQQIKYPVKAALGRSMAFMIDRLNAVVYPVAIRKLQDTDQTVLEYFRKGGDLKRVPATRRPNAVFAQLSAEIDCNDPNEASRTTASSGTTETTSDPKGLPNSTDHPRTRASANDRETVGARERE